MNNSKNNNLVLPYYVTLFLLMVLMGTATAPSMAVRMLFLAAFVVPLFMFGYLMPPVIICTMTLLSVTGTVLYLPLPYTEYYYYAIIIILLLRSREKITYNSVLPFFLFWLYVVFVDFATGSQHQGMKQYLPMLLLLGLACSCFHYDRRAIPILLNTFCLISILSSVLFFLNYQTFLVEYNTFGLERSGWNDPNYFSCILGIGLVAAIIQLLRKERANLLVKTFWLATILTSFVVQILLASRTGILAVTVASLVVLLFLKVPTKYKLLITIVAVGFIIYLYNNGYFELLEYRINDDTTGGSGRTDIWVKKLDSFLNSGNSLNWLFGYGYDGGLRLGYGSKLAGVHNDFIAILIEYGIVGFGFFIWGLIWPYKQTSAKYKSVVLVLLVYLAVVCLFLEPLTMGNFPYMCYYLVICSISENKASYKYVE